MRISPSLESQQRTARDALCLLLRLSHSESIYIYFFNLFRFLKCYMDYKKKQKRAGAKERQRKNAIASLKKHTKNLYNRAFQCKRIYIPSRMWRGGRKKPKKTKHGPVELQSLVAKVGEQKEALRGAALLAVAAAPVKYRRGTVSQSIPTSTIDKLRPQTPGEREPIRGALLRQRLSHSANGGPRFTPTWRAAELRPFIINYSDPAKCASVSVCVRVSAAFRFKELYAS